MDWWDGGAPNQDWKRETILTQEQKRSCAKRNTQEHTGSPAFAEVRSTATKNPIHEWSPRRQSNETKLLRTGNKSKIIENLNDERCELFWFVFVETVCHTNTWRKVQGDLYAQLLFFLWIILIDFLFFEKNQTTQNFTRNRLVQLTSSHSKVTTSFILLSLAPLPRSLVQTITFIFKKRFEQSVPILLTASNRVITFRRTAI